jgi:hypothetical protein
LDPIFPASLHLNPISYALVPYIKTMHLSRALVVHDVILATQKAEIRRIEVQSQPLGK